jgi:hypothetical protein
MPCLIPEADLLRLLGNPYLSIDPASDRKADL